MTTPDRRITDPERIRALAHPVRLELLDYLRDVAQATATECAAHIGESVASCSFHLRMLEKYGYLERAERRGREKPWRALPGGWDVRPSPDVPESLPAAVEVGALFMVRETERVHRFLATAGREPQEWIQAITVTTSSFWATSEEMAQLSKDVQTLTDRFDGRHDDPAQRPPGARQGRLFATVNPDPLPEPSTDEEGHDE